MRPVSSIHCLHLFSFNSGLYIQFWKVQSFTKTYIHLCLLSKGNCVNWGRCKAVHVHCCRSIVPGSVKHIHHIFQAFLKNVRIFGAFHSCLFARVCQTHPSHFWRLLKNCLHFRSLSLLSACFKLYGEETGASPVWPWLQPTVQIRIFGGLPGKEAAKREAADNKNFKMLLPTTGSSTTDAERSYCL